MKFILLLHEDIKNAYYAEKEYVSDCSGRE